MMEIMKMDRFDLVFHFWNPPNITPDGFVHGSMMGQESICTIRGEGESMQKAIFNALASFGLIMDEKLIKKCEAIDMAGVVSSLEYEVKSANERAERAEKREQELRQRMKDILGIEECGGCCDEEDNE